MRKKKIYSAPAVRTVSLLMPTCILAGSGSSLGRSVRIDDEEDDDSDGHLQSRLWTVEYK